MRTFSLLTILFFIGISPSFAQITNEIKTEQENVILKFFQLLLQDTPVTVSQSYDVFNPEETWNVDYYNENLTEKQQNEFYEGDPDTLISRTFEKIENFDSALIPDIPNETLDDKFLRSLNIEMISSDGKQMKVNSYKVTSHFDENWKVQIGFYGHPFNQVSKIVISDSLDILKEIGLTN